MMIINPHDEQYHNLLQHIMENGVDTDDRTGTGTRAVFGHQMRFDLSKGFPLLTTKKVSFGLILSELLWFIAGDTQLETLLRDNNHIWSEWPYNGYLLKNKIFIPKKSDEWKEGMKKFENKILTDKEFSKKWGDLGPIYGYQWRNWPDRNGQKIDQLAQVVEQIKKRSNSRRLIVSAWNPADIEEMAVAGLPPCHCLFQFKVLGGKLHCQLYQRSCDTFLGVPFNIASYALLTQVIAHVAKLEAGDLVWTGGDVHLYKNHFNQAKEQLSRESRPAPTLWINPEVKDIFSLKKEDFRIDGYDPHPAIKAPISV